MQESYTGQKTKLCWARFVNTVNEKTPMKKIWNMINKINNKNNDNHINYITQNNRKYETDEEIAEILAN